MEQREKQVVKNSAILYVRLLFTMAISLYTSRVILNVLGIEDFGIFTVIAGFISMFSILSDSLSNSISRFIAVALGKEDLNYLKKIFSTSVNIQILLSVFILVLLELVGLWFVDNKLNIPIERRPILNIIFQLSVINFSFGIIRVAFSSLIIAHEHASFFAKISISEAVLKLVIVFLIKYTTYDRLVAYVFLLMVVTILITVWAIIYCVRIFEECKYRLDIDKDLTKSMFGFASWSLVGQGSRVVNFQGINVLLNLFFGVTVNAARGIASQVDGATSQFTNNIMIAINPQIMKSYSTGDYDYMRKLVCQGSKYAGYITLLFLIPLLLETDIVLKLWLGVVPEYTAIFTRLTLIATLALVMSSTLNTLIQATGDVKKYQLSYGLVMLANIPVSYMALYIGAPAWIVYVLYLLLNLLLIFVHIYFVKIHIPFSGGLYFKDVVWKIVYIFLLSAIVPFLLILILDQSKIRLLLVSLMSIVSVIVSVYFLGLNNSERSSAKDAISKMNNNFIRHNK